MPTVQFKDYYKTLGVARTADEKAVRTAYRKLARQHHPDINPGDPGAEERFKDLNEAYEVLSAPDKRKLYDRFGEDWQRYREAGFTGDEPAPRPGGAPPRTAAPDDFGSWFAGQAASGRARPGAGEWTVHEAGGEDDGGHFSDFFQTLFGGRARETGRSGVTASQPRTRRGEDLEVAVEVSFEEAFRGATRAIQLQAPQTCPTCNGTGLARGTTCPTCDGSGVVHRARALEVTIPPGVATGSRVRIAGQGGPGLIGGPSGDVYLRIAVQPDPRFEREGDDLRTDVDVPLTTAVLGGEVVVVTPTGRVALSIPAETQPDRLFRLRGQGMPRLKGAKGQRGDLVVRSRVVLPAGLGPRERELFEELKRLRDGGTR